MSVGRNVNQVGGAEAQSDIQPVGKGLGAAQRGAMTEGALEIAEPEDEAAIPDRLAREGVNEADRARMLESRRDEEGL